MVGLDLFVSLNLWNSSYFLAVANDFPSRLLEDYSMKQSSTDHDDNVDNPTRWCIIGKRESASRGAKAHPYHFPHMAENLLPCWSWFRAQNATTHCGLVLLDGIKLDYKKSEEPSWISQLVQYMGCKVKELDVINANISNRLLPLGSSEPFQHAILPVWKMPRGDPSFRYLADPQDAQELRRLIVSDDWIDRHHQANKLYIGIIQRTVSMRTFTDLDVLVNLVQDCFPDAILDVTTLHGMSLQQQARWFALQDVVFAAHGAALTNSIFLRRQSIVMQFYPKGFFYQMFEPLIEQSGSNALFWYPDDNPHTETKYRLKILANKENITIGNDLNVNKNRLIKPIVEMLYSIGKMKPPSDGIQGEYFNLVL